MQEKMGTRQTYTWALAALSTALFISSLWMVSSYLNFYKTTMGTEVDIEILEADILTSTQSVLLRFTVTNPLSEPFEVIVMNFQIDLDGKYLTTDSIRETFEVSKDDAITIERRIEIPEEWKRTVDDAIEGGIWSWSVSGSLHLKTFMGETRIRFESVIDFNPLES
jgi:hypothetical protein